MTLPDVHVLQQFHQLLKGGHQGPSKDLVAMDIKPGEEAMTSDNHIYIQDVPKCAKKCLPLHPLGVKILSGTLWAGLEILIVISGYRSTPHPVTLTFFHHFGIFL